MANPQVPSENLTPEPLTLEGSSVLHSMYRVRWSALRGLPAGTKGDMVGELLQVFQGAENENHTATYSVFGHKADLLVVHFRPTFEELKAAELAFDSLAIREYLEPSHSYLSMVELGLYDSSLKLYRQLKENGVAQNSPEWTGVIEETIARQREAMKVRLFPKIPAARYICFYPMDRRRGEDKNWYVLPIENRQKQMDVHGNKGRRWAGKVLQIISGSIGFDDWEWAVDLFSNDPVNFKKLIYEMRFDEVSAEYSNFGVFIVGLRCAIKDLGQIFDGNVPKFDAGPLSR
ncbi:MAG: hydrogen peroxide-dependent heme synthase [Acidobacteriaceae bacterium]